MPELDWSKAPIQQEIRRDFTTPELGIEGSLNCTKTTLLLDKEIEAALKYPGIQSLLFRWTKDATEQILQPAFEEVLAIRDVHAAWDNNQKHYTFGNGSRIWMHPLKTVSQVDLFKKIRGRGLFRISGDQCEEMEKAVAEELGGRMRPSLTATMSDRTFPFQITLVWNCEDHDFWLSKMFPLDNHIKGRKVYSLSIYDNPFIPQASVDSLLRNFPPDHPKHQTMVLGKRAPNIVGEAVFEGLYRKAQHWVPIKTESALPIYESYEFGKHNPTWVIAQMPAIGSGLKVIGGIRGEGLMLDDFVDAITPYRSKWLAGAKSVQSCMSPMGGGVSGGGRYTPMDLIRKMTKTEPRSSMNGNAPDVRLAMIESISTYLRRRSMTGQECFAVSNDEDKFLIISKDGIRQSAFVHHAMEAGYVWDKHFVSISNKELRQAREDDKFSNAMHCLENILLNFGLYQQPVSAPVVTKPHRRISPYG